MDLTDGRAQYGEFFNNYFYFLELHVAKSGESGWSPFHRYPSFHTGHFAFSLKLDQALQSVDKTVVQVGGHPTAERRAARSDRDERRITTTTRGGLQTLGRAGVGWVVPAWVSVRFRRGSRSAAADRLIARARGGVARRRRARGWTQNSCLTARASPSFLLPRRGSGVCSRTGTSRSTRRTMTRRAGSSARSSRRTGSRTRTRTATSTPR